MTHTLTFALTLMLLSGCVGRPPRRDYLLADAAMVAAKSADALQYAPGLFTKAQEYYLKGQRNFSDRDYSDARNNFNLARDYAERAENYTVLKKSENGDAN